MHRLCTALPIALFAAPVAAATIDFEDLGANLPISGNYYYDGCNAAGPPTDFSSQGATFNNDTATFGTSCFWQGWAYSQTTDTTTPGFGNQYSAIPGAGAAGSATYGVTFTGGGATQAATSRITFGEPVSLVAAALTNTTYAALSMRDGDGFAKKFGGASGSDPDYFLLTITGRDAFDAVTGSVEFALADFRFAEDELDYIVMQWVFVDLAGLGSIAALEFELESSDIGEFGMNTPAYFALDDLMFVPEPHSAALLAFGLALLARRRS